MTRWHGDRSCLVSRSFSSPTTVNEKVTKSTWSEHCLQAAIILAINMCLCPEDLSTPFIVKWFYGGKKRISVEEKCFIRRRGNCYSFTLNSPACSRSPFPGVTCSSSLRGIRINHCLTSGHPKAKTLALGTQKNQSELFYQVGSWNMILTRNPAFGQHKNRCWKYCC
jgi:hypothetical protein